MRTMRGRFDPWSWYAASRLMTSHNSRGVEDKLASSNNKSASSLKWTLAVFT